MILPGGYEVHSAKRIVGRFNGPQERADFSSKFKMTQCLLRISMKQNRESCARLWHVRVSLVMVHVASIFHRVMETREFIFNVGMEV